MSRSLSAAAGLYPERYEHIWEGEYAKAFEGAYFAAALAAAKEEGIIGRVAADPLLPRKILSGRIPRGFCLTRVAHRIL